MINDNNSLRPILAWPTSLIEKYYF